jgi:hypothetical protein
MVAVIPDRRFVEPASAMAAVAITPAIAMPIDRTTVGTSTASIPIRAPARIIIIRIAVAG